MKESSGSPGHPSGSRPTLGVSSCLLGEQVRHDGGHRRSERLLRLLDGFQVVSVCPEVGLGLGVPRPMIRIEAGAGAEVRLVRMDDRVDLTARMLAFAERRIAELLDEGLDGFVLKDRSPSCGVEGVAVVNADGSGSRAGSGFFAAALRRLAPALPVIDEERLFGSDRSGFLAAVRAAFERRRAVSKTDTRHDGA